MAVTAPEILMVPGAFCGGWVFDRFRQPLEAAGLSVRALDLPGHEADREPAAARRRLSRMGMGDYARFVAGEVEACAAAPILVGHSMGGLVAQLAAARAEVAALVLLAPSGGWGVVGQTVEEAVSAVGLYALGPFWSRAIEPDYRLAKLYSFNRLDREARHAAFARMTPESGLALFQTLNWWLDPFMSTSVGSLRGAPPVLCLAGGADVIHPPATVRQTAERLGGELQVFPGLSHWLQAEPGHEAVAAATLDWLERRGVLAGPAPQRRRRASA